MCPPLLSEPPRGAGLAAAGQGLHRPRLCLTGGPGFLYVLQRTKSHQPFPGLAWSLLSLPPAKGEAESGPGGVLPYVVTLKKIDGKKNLFIQVELYLFTSVLAMTCVFTTHLELRVAAGVFGSHPSAAYKKT